MGRITTSTEALPAGMVARWECLIIHAVLPIAARCIARERAARPPVRLIGEHARVPDSDAFGRVAATVTVGLVPGGWSLSAICHRGAPGDPTNSPGL